MAIQVNVWSLFDLLAPACAACGLRHQSPGGRLCPGCSGDLPRLVAPCPRCALPAGGDCPCRRTPSPVDATLAAGAYAFPLDALVQQLKFGGRLPLARPLGLLLADAVAARGGPLPQALVPVPLHPDRARQRGFNQAAAIAGAAGRALGIPLAAAAVARCRATAPQSGLDLAARQRNLHDAFRVLSPLPAHVALVDDVITTGSTMAALATTLRRHGVARVEAWAVARTL